LTGDLFIFLVKAKGYLHTTDVNDRAELRNFFADRLPYRQFDRSNPYNQIDTSVPTDTIALSDILTKRHPVNAENRI